MSKKGLHVEEKKYLIENKETSSTMTKYTKNMHFKKWHSKRSLDQKIWHVEVSKMRIEHQQH